MIFSFRTYIRKKNFRFRYVITFDWCQGNGVHVHFDPHIEKSGKRYIVPRSNEEKWSLEIR